MNPIIIVALLAGVYALTRRNSGSSSSSLPPLSPAQVTELAMMINSSTSYTELVALANFAAQHGEVALANAAQGRAMQIGPQVTT